MKTKHKDISLEALCELFGYSRQAYYNQRKNHQKKITQAEIVLDMVERIRKNKPRYGTRKLYLEMKSELIDAGIKLGRDSLFKLLRDNNLLIRKRKNYTKTTNSHHWLKKHPNLVKGLVPKCPNKLWVADITYLKTDKGFIYLYLLTDAYSRKIVGWHLSENLLAESAVEALEMALREETIAPGLIHHSDRGIQYCSSQYVTILESANIKISMTENSDPLENAIAERINGILKDEWIYDMKINGIEDGKVKVAQIIQIYNTDRLHSSIDMLTPLQAHSLIGELKKHWKNYYNKEKV